MEDVLDIINQSDDMQIVQIISAVTKRYNRLFPDWEVMFLSLPRGKGREQAIRETVEYLLKREI